MNDALRAAAAPAVVPTMSAAPAPSVVARGLGSHTRARAARASRWPDRGRAASPLLPRWTRMLEQLTSQALTRLAENQPIDPNDPDTWRNRDAHAEAVLRRHRLARVNASRLTSAAVGALIEGQAQADRDAGIDWTTLANNGCKLDERLSRAHARLPVKLEDPAMWAHRTDQRRVLASRLGLADEHADALSRWVLAHPDQFDPDDLRSWRIGSATWLELADRHLGTVATVERPVGLFLVPAIRAGDGWQLMPVLSLEMIRLTTELGGRFERDLRSAVLPIGAREQLLERINLHTLHAGPKQCLDSAAQLSQELSRELGVTLSPGLPRDPRDRWGRLAVRRRSYKCRTGDGIAELELRAVTFPARGFTQRRLGSAPRDEFGAQPSAVIDLGEAVQTAIDAGLPLLLSTEAAGELKDTVPRGADEGPPGDAGRSPPPTGCPRAPGGSWPSRRSAR